jgi:hypothetical protein
VPNDVKLVSFSKCLLTVHDYYVNKSAQISAEEFMV